MSFHNRGARSVASWLLFGGVGLLVLTGCTSPVQHRDARVVTASLVGGFDIRAGDYGRPVPLYAGMLGVTPDNFRRAFSGVHPDTAHDPSTAEQQVNKVALMSVLSQYRVTNDQLDRVANYYRFDSTAGQTWPHRAARVEATIVDGKVTKIRILDAGVGYTYPPQLVIPGFTSVRAAATIVFTNSFDTNGHIGAITLT